MPEISFLCSIYLKNNLKISLFACKPHVSIVRLKPDEKSSLGQEGSGDLKGLHIR